MEGADGRGPAAAERSPQPADLPPRRRVLQARLRQLRRPLPRILTLCAPNLQARMPSLTALQGETPMMRVCVDAQIVGEVLSAWTGIPGGQDAEG